LPLERSRAIAHFADRLLAQCDAKGAPVCVGLDPVYEKLPRALLADHDDPADANQKLDAIRRFGEGVLDAVAEAAPVVKLQLACFERYGAAGWAVYEHLLQRARSLDLLVIADAKRGDIGASSAHYAAGLLAGDNADALTVNPLVGMDGLTPFIDVAANDNKGLFALVRMSNPGAEAIQGLTLHDGRSVSDAVADTLHQTMQSRGDDVSETGYSLMGAVVGATKPAVMTALRQRLPRALFLVPGVGAQGGSAEDVRPCFHDDGRGALITASRSIIYAFDAEDDDWQSSIADAAARLRDEIRGVLGA
jgi:orotidine-5'-phosphate decarboxylase